MPIMCDKGKGDFYLGRSGLSTFGVLPGHPSLTRSIWAISLVGGVVEKESELSWPWVGNFSSVLAQVLAAILKLALEPLLQAKDVNPNSHSSPPELDTKAPKTIFPEGPPVRQILVSRALCMGLLEEETHTIQLFFPTET